MIPQRAVGYGASSSARSSKNLRHGQAEGVGRADRGWTLRLDLSGLLAASAVTNTNVGCATPSFSASTVRAGDAPASVVLGDFNLDGKPDLAVTNNETNTVTLRVGDASGNTTRQAFRVTVPLNQRGAPAVEDAAALTVNSRCP